METNQEPQEQTKDVLVVYYSRTGHVKKMAEIIQKETNGDIFEVKTADDNNYSDSYLVACFQAGKHLLSGFLPKLTENIDISKYKTIYIGTPVWWYTISRPMASFLKEADFTGKTIIPFLSEGSSGYERAINALKEAIPNATILDEFVFIEKKPPADLDKDIKDWLEAVHKKVPNEREPPVGSSNEAPPEGNNETPENNNPTN
ncbi:flavodoxin [Histomonas meleagridis]|uniref:flavodoxin n=1 Tax=Histomonas meleagridis TaxID=135588 RepID=UPI00355AA8F6|nr:flavodoxin [Histomonas meleagridis]KAH0796757.1 flavodoxin [Histomonas meleagridis]